MMFVRSLIDWLADWLVSVPTCCRKTAVLSEQQKAGVSVTKNNDYTYRHGTRPTYQSSAVHRSSVLCEFAESTAARSSTRDSVG